MGRDSADEPSADSNLATPQRLAPTGPVMISVCITCRSAEDGAVAGPELLATMTAAFGDPDERVKVRPVQCLGVCKRPATAAVTSPDGYSFLFGDLQAESGAAALVSFVRGYQTADYGLVPWRQRAEVLRKGMVARVPPLRWSPDDGRAPT